MKYLKQSTVASIKLGPFVDSGDAFTAETGLTLAVKTSKNGGAKAARSSATAIAHDADGDYTVELDATDTGTIGRLRVSATAAGALPVWDDFSVLHANVYDVLFGSVAPSTLTAAAAATQVWADAPAGDPLADIGDEVWSTSRPQGRSAATVISGTAFGTPTTTTMSASVDLAPTVADQFKGRLVQFARDTTTAALRGQMTDITASTVPGSGNVGLTFTALTTAPASGDTFCVV